MPCRWRLVGDGYQRHVVRLNGPHLVSKRQRADRTTTLARLKSHRLCRRPLPVSVSMRQMHALRYRTAATCSAAVGLKMHTHAYLHSLLYPKRRRLHAPGIGKSLPRRRRQISTKARRQRTQTPRQVITIAADGRSDLESRLAWTASGNSLAPLLFSSQAARSLFTSYPVVLLLSCAPPAEVVRHAERYSRQEKPTTPSRLFPTPGPVLRCRGSH